MAGIGWEEEEVLLLETITKKKHGRLKFNKSEICKSILYYSQLYIECGYLPKILSPPLEYIIYYKEVTTFARLLSSK